MNVLELRHVSKTFGEIRSLSDVDFRVEMNQIVGLLGDNGAGKSTLIKIITGYLQPDNGSKIFWNGWPVKRLDIAYSRALGIEAVYQERALADLQPVWRNVFMGRELVKNGVLDKPRMREETQALMDKIGFTGRAVTPDTIVQTMSGGERQGIAIARALYFDAELVILDEPTMGLSITETRKVLEFIQAIKTAGKSCVFIDHNIFHVYPVADWITILDRGRVAAQIDKKQYTLDGLTEYLYVIAGTNNKT
jgi:simple sugar transport system ATP-binding protein